MLLRSRIPSKSKARLRVCQCLFPLVFMAAAAWAQDGIAKYRNYTPKQIADMPEALRSKEVPLLYIFAARSGLSPDSDTLFAMYLNSLMYPGMHDYAAAVRQFQRDLGDKPDGVFTVGQIASLERRAGAETWKGPFSEHLHQPDQRDNSHGSRDVHNLG